MPVFGSLPPALGCLLTQPDRRKSGTKWPLKPRVYQTAVLAPGSWAEAARAEIPKAAVLPRPAPRPRAPGVEGRVSDGSIRLPGAWPSGGAFVARRGAGVRPVCGALLPRHSCHTHSVTLPARGRELSMRHSICPPVLPTGRVWPTPMLFPGGLSSCRCPRT